MTERNKVLFLDIDGPMIPTRAACLSNSGIWCKFDPVAVRLINILLKETGAKIVISSSWRTSGVSYVSLALELNGIDSAHLHIDWMIGKRGDGVCSSSKGRAQKIKNWLGGHPEVTHYASLDDMYLEGVNNVQVSTSNGLMWEDYHKLLKALS